MTINKNFRWHALCIVIITSLAFVWLAGGAGAETLNGIGDYTPSLFFTDDFDGSALNSEWTVINNNSDSSVSLTGTGYLQINASPKNGGSDYYDGSNYNAPRIILQRDVSGYYGGIVETKMIFSPTNNYQSAGILSCSEDNPDSNSCVKVAVRAFSPLAGGSVVMSGPGAYVGFTNSTIYFRLMGKGKGMSVKGWYSSDGVNWILNGDGIVNFTTKYIGLFAVRQPWDGNTNLYSAADFDYVNIIKFNETTLTVDDSGGADYSRIQDAIDNATAGDTILVYSGTYYENVNVNKRLTLRGIGIPVVDARGVGSAITLTAEGIRLEGFTAIGAGYYPDAGIKVISSNNVISGNNATLNNDSGIVLSSSSNNTLNDNTVSNSPNGISIFLSNDNNVVHNQIHNTTDQGIILNFAINIILKENNASSNSGEGILLMNSSYTSILNNTANSNGQGGGICLMNSNNNTISDNNASKNNYAGIYLESSSNNTFIGNNALNNGYGIVLLRSGYNVIYNNHFNNINNIEFMGTNINTWNITKQSGTNIIGGFYLGGNFWANPSGTGFSQTCMDGNNDGISDTPYSLDSYNFDYLPLAYNITQTLVDSYLTPTATPAERKAGLIRAMDDYFDNGLLTKDELLSVLDAYFA